MLRKKFFVLITGISGLVFFFLAADKMLDANAVSMRVRRLNESIQLMHSKPNSIYTQDDLGKVRNRIRSEESRYYQNPKEKFYSFAADSVAGAAERRLRVHETIAAQQGDIPTWELMVAGSETSILAYLDDLADMGKYVVFTAVSIQRADDGARARITMYLPEIPEYDPTLSIETPVVDDEHLREEVDWTASRIAATLFRSLPGRSMSASFAPLQPQTASSPAAVQSNRSPAWVEVVGRYRKPSGRLVLALKDTRVGAVHSLEDGKKLNGWSIKEQPDRSVLLFIDENSYVLDLE